MRPWKHTPLDQEQSMTPEGKVKLQINRALATLDRRIYKFMPVQSGYGKKTLDYLLCVNGYFIAIEAKAPGKDFTALQTQTAEDICAAGGRVFLVDGLHSLARATGVIHKCL
jgi:hypothetical protein